MRKYNRPSCARTQRGDDLIFPRQFSSTIYFPSQEIQQRAVKSVRRFQVRNVSDSLEFNQLAVRNVTRCLFAELRVLSRRAADFFIHIISADHRSIFLPDDEQRRRSG